MHLLGKNNFEIPSAELGFNYDYDFPFLHDHDYWEFVFTIYPIMHTINRETYPIEKSSIIIIKPTDFHSVSAIDSPENPEKLPTLLNLKISESALERLFSPYAPDIIQKMKSINYQPKQIHSIPAIFDHLISFTNHSYSSSQIDTITMLIKASISYIIFEYLSDILNSELPTVSNPPEELILIAKRLNSPSYYNLQIADIIQNAFYSKMHISRLFKKYFHCTMEEYFLNSKLNYAKNQLKYTNNSVLHIAIHLNMTLPRFDSFFKKRVGISPSQFRKEFQKQSNNTN